MCIKCFHFNFVFISICFSSFSRSLYVCVCVYERALNRCVCVWLLLQTCLSSIRAKENTHSCDWCCSGIIVQLINFFLFHRITYKAKSIEELWNTQFYKHKMLWKRKKKNCIYAQSQIHQRMRQSMRLLRSHGSEKFGECKLIHVDIGA